VANPCPITGDHEFHVMRVSGIEDSKFLSLGAVKASGRVPEIATMNRPSFRMILFIVVLSAGHMASMSPLADSSLHRPQRQILTGHQPSPPSHLGAAGSEPPRVSKMMARTI